VSIGPRQAAPGPRAQRGVALLFGLILFALIGVSVIISIARGSDPEIERDRRTERALAHAKAALIGYAVDVLLSPGNRLGGLPCPDMFDNGSAELACGDAAGSSPESRLGRLPWRTLGLPDLRDGDGERLWYAVSNGFKNNTPTSCITPNDPGCINSESRGTISVHAPTGSPSHDGTNPDPYAPSGAIALIIAPGRILTRLGAPGSQNRTPEALDPSKPQLNPVNYLDTASGLSGPAPTIDNAVNNERFVSGPVFDASGKVIINDRILAITYQDLIPRLENRVARELRICLDEYAAANGARYPWASDTSASAVSSGMGLAFPDTDNMRWGRIADDLLNTSSSSGATMAATWPLFAPTATPPTYCKLAWDWWRNWKLHAFYVVADAFKPADTSTVPACTTPTSCLTVNRLPSPAATNVRYIVVVAGKRLGVLPQLRGDLGQRSNPINYLEGENILADLNPDTFVLTRPAANFNDAGVFKQ
jgi:hypothetical protein